MILLSAQNISKTDMERMVLNDVSFFSQRDGKIRRLQPMQLTSISCRKRASGSCWLVSKTLQRPSGILLSAER